MHWAVSTHNCPAYARIRGSLLTFDHWSHIFFISIANKCNVRFSSISIVVLILSLPFTCCWSERDAIFPIPRIALKWIYFLHWVQTNFNCFVLSIVVTVQLNAVNFQHFELIHSIFRCMFERFSVTGDTSGIVFIDPHLSVRVTI